ncbi:VOC family protein [Micromonospora andamanensis]|uniref:VOC family protein n=1 Tax=Micromonospora andamanensis TaxID=1287068 RepID=UPI00300D7412
MGGTRPGSSRSQTAARRPLARQPAPERRALRLVQVNVKARDESALGPFWADALGWGVSVEEPSLVNVEPLGFAWPDPSAVCIDVVVVPNPETVRYRAHLDLATTSVAHQAELVSRLTDLGATPADIGQGDVPWTCWPTRRATCPACWSLGRSTGTPGRSPPWWSPARIRAPWPASGVRRQTGPCTR